MSRDAERGWAEPTETGTGGFAVRIRVGVARFEDGWNVVVRFGEGTTNVYDPTFATEAEAEAKAAEVASGIRNAYAVEGPRQ